MSRGLRGTFKVAEELKSEGSILQSLPGVVGQLVDKANPSRVSIPVDRAEREEADQCELIPFWHVETHEDIRIERVIPLYPFSKDHGRLEHILKTLAIYRLAFGQPRQAELVDHLLERNLSEEEIQHIMETLMVNLSPIRYEREDRGQSIKPPTS